MTALARKDENLWKCILGWNKPDKTTMSLVNTIKHISANSSLLRAQIISWIVRDEVSLGYVVPKTASFNKGNSSTDRILTHDNAAKTKGNLPVDIETPEVAANLAAHNETQAESQPVNIEMPSESEPLDNEMPSEILTAETETPAESQPVNMEMPSESLPTETEMPAEGQPVHMEMPSESLPAETETPAESQPVHMEIPSESLPAETEMPVESTA